MKCPRCEQDNPSHAMFCLACGAPVNEAPSQARRYAELKDEIQSLRQSLSMAHGSPLIFVTRPIAVILIGAGLALTAWSLVARRRR